jgi:predicted DNA-binding ribbon-helix-helix protein
MAAMHKRSIKIGGHRTSVALEQPFWEELTAIARARRVPLSTLIAEIDRARGAGNLASALRLHVLEILRGKISRA